VFEKCIDVLAECCKVAFEKMTDANIKSVNFTRTKEVSEKYSVVHVIPYEEFDKKMKGDFMLGFGDEQAAVLVASAIAGKMGLPPLKQFDGVAADAIGEFMNTVVGNAISSWDKMKIAVRFSHPVMERDRKIETAKLSSYEAYQIVLDVGGGRNIANGKIMLIVTFSACTEDCLKGRRILVVDDSELVRQYLTKALREEGVEVQTAVNGRDGVEKHKTFKPELTVMDLVMPEMEGFDAITMIRE